jgi:hypothetical protein
MDLKISGQTVQTSVKQKNFLYTILRKVYQVLEGVKDLNYAEA